MKHYQYFPEKEKSARKSVIGGASFQMPGVRPVGRGHKFIGIAVPIGAVLHSPGAERKPAGT